MNEDLIFNIDDLNFSQEELNFVKGNEEEAKPQETEVVEATNQEEISTEIKETTNSETEDKEDNKETTEDTPSSEADSSQSTLYALAKYLKDEGVLFIEEELSKVETLDELKSLVKASNDRAKYVGLNESQRRYQEALENGVPLNEFENIEKDITTFKNIKEEDFQNNDQLKFEVIALDFINQGIERDKAIRLAQISIKDPESSFETAKESLNNILDFKTKEFQKLIENNKQSTKLELEKIKEFIFEKDSLLEMKMNEITKNKLFDLMTTKVDNDEKGIPLNKMQKWQKENPLESAVLLNYLYLMTNEGKNLGLIKTNTTSTAAKDLEKKLKEMNFDKNGSLIIPDHMYREDNRSSKNSQNQNQNLKINI